MRDKDPDQNVRPAKGKWGKITGTVAVWELSVNLRKDAMKLDAASLDSNAAMWKRLMTSNENAVLGSFTVPGKNPALISCTYFSLSGLAAHSQNLISVAWTPFVSTIVNLRD